MRRMGSSGHCRKAVAGLSFVADDCWLNPDVEVQASAIEGQGLFAIKRIPRGEIVSRLGGRVVTTAGLHRLIDESAHYVDTITVGDDHTWYCRLAHRRVKGTTLVIRTWPASRCRARAGSSTAPACSVGWSPGCWPVGGEEPAEGVA
jgi:hypothetical protein